jgi:diadenosine tetraphosphate (Ap4A) HIT family hydrolase
MFARRATSRRAPVHVLIIPRRHVATLDELEQWLLGRLVATAL